MDTITIIGLAVVAGLLLWANGGQLLGWLRTLWPSSVTPGPDDGDEDGDGDNVDALKRTLTVDLLEARDLLLEMGEIEAARHVSDAIASLVAVEIMP